MDAPEMSEKVGRLAEFAVPFTYGLCKLRDAAKAGHGASLDAAETKAVVEAFRLLNQRGES